MGGMRAAQNVFFGRFLSGSDPTQLDGGSCPTFSDPGSWEPRQGATFLGHVSLAEGRVGGALEASGANFNGNLNMGGLQLEGSLYMNKAAFGPILTLTGTSVRGDIQYGGGRPPSKQADLVGFQYERVLSEGLETQQVDVQTLLSDLLALQRFSSPQPYEHLASVLRRMGDPEAATYVLYEGAKRNWWSRVQNIINQLSELKRSFSWTTMVGVSAFAFSFGGFSVLMLYGRVFLSLLSLGLAGALAMWFHLTSIALSWTATSVEFLYGIVVGFGQYPELAMFWVVVFTLLGALILRRSPEARGKGWPWCIGASLDHLLPIVELNKEFSDFFDDPKRERMSDRQLAYFAFHALVGFVLASFVVAGLSGLTVTR